jgi:hypothetical protein
MEAFEAELHEAKATSSKTADGDEEEGADGDDAPRGEDIDIDGDIGDDVFAAGEAPVGLESGSEAWLKSDRDYTYPEVLILYSCEAWVMLMAHIPASYTFLRTSTCRQPRPPQLYWKEIHHRTSFTRS